MRPILLIGGLDTSEGAGVTMDARVAQLLGVPTEVILTSLAVQSHQRAFRLLPAKPLPILERLRKIPRHSISAVKIGALGETQGWSEIMEILSSFRVPIVVDPVVRTSSGGLLTAGTASKIRQLYQEVFGHRITVLTPNLSEAAFLLGTPLAKFRRLEEIVAALEDTFCCPILLKGGHARERRVTDILCRNGQLTRFTHPRLMGPELRGTGCALATALAGHLARYRSLVRAAGLAVELHQAWMRRAKNRKGGGNSSAQPFIIRIGLKRP